MRLFCFGAGPRDKGEHVHWSLERGDFLGPCSCMQQSGKARPGSSDRTICCARLTRSSGGGAPIPSTHSARLEHTARTPPRPPRPPPAPADDLDRQRAAADGRPARRDGHARAVRAAQARRDSAVRGGHAVRGRPPGRQPLAAALALVPQLHPPRRRRVQRPPREGGDDPVHRVPALQGGAAPELPLLARVLPQQLAAAPGVPPPSAGQLW